MKALVLAVAVLASVPWQGIAYTDNHVGWHARGPARHHGVRAGAAAASMSRSASIMDWKTRLLIRPAPGALVA